MGHLIIGQDPRQQEPPRPRSGGASGVSALGVLAEAVENFREKAKEVAPPLATMIAVRRASLAQMPKLRGVASPPPPPQFSTPRLYVDMHALKGVREILILFLLKRSFY